MLTKLELGGNFIQVLVDGAFRGLSSLEALNLGGIGIYNVSVGAFDGLSGLKDISLGSNYIAALPVGVFRDLTNVIWMYLAYNRIGALEPGVFVGLNAIQSLSMSSNRLTTISSDTFVGLETVHFLDLSNNNLVSVSSKAFWRLPWLTVQDGMPRLNLNTNRLSILPRDVFKLGDSSVSVALWENPLVCLPQSLPPWWPTSMPLCPYEVRTYTELALHYVQRRCLDMADLCVFLF
jgi:hypothetical protein